MFPFTIRDVLWLAVIVAMTCGWAMHYRQLARTRSTLLEVESWREQEKRAFDSLVADIESEGHSVIEGTDGRAYLPKPAPGE